MTSEGIKKVGAEQLCAVRVNIVLSRACKPLFSSATPKEVDGFTDAVHPCDSLEALQQMMVNLQQFPPR